MSRIDIILGKYDESHAAAILQECDMELAGELQEYRAKLKAKQNLYGKAEAMVDEEYREEVLQGIMTEDDKKMIKLLKI